MAFARVNGIVLHYKAFGAPENPVLVFANSLGTDFRIWDTVVERLADDFRIICYDKRGHGLSEASPQPYVLADHINDLEALLTHLGIKRMALVGLSVGGMIAQGLAARRPDLITALVLCDTAHKIGSAEMWNARIDAVNEKGIAAILDQIMERWFTASYRSPDNPAYEGYRAMVVRTPVDGYAGTCAALRDADLTASTSTLELPTLCIAGAQDGSTPPDLVQKLAGLIANARFEMIENAAHIPCVEQPEKLATLIGDFLKTVEPS